MITIYCALHPEAKALIEHYALKKESQMRHFQVFSNEERQMRLVITGVGAIRAAVAVAELSTIYPPQKEDMLINYGSCAATKNAGMNNVYLCNKLTEKESGRTFYPDILYPHPFQEAELISLAQVKTDGKEQGTKAMLFDMEGAAIYQAANVYYGPHQMIFVKTVTDYGVQASEEKSNFQKQFQEYMNHAAELLIPYIDAMCRSSHQMQLQEEQNIQTKQSLEQEIERLSADMHCSVTMRMELAQQLWYWKLAGFDYERRLQEYYEQGILPCRDKRVGRRILDEIKTRWL